jgi:hypothetical protein
MQALLLLPEGLGLNTLPCLARWRKRLSLLKISKSTQWYGQARVYAPSIELSMADVTCLQIGCIVAALMTSQMLLACERPATVLCLAMELSGFHVPPTAQDSGEMFSASHFAFRWAAGSFKVMVTLGAFSAALSK